MPAGIQRSGGKRCVVKGLCGGLPLGRRWRDTPDEGLAAMTVAYYCGASLQRNFFDKSFNSNPILSRQKSRTLKRWKSECRQTMK